MLASYISEVHIEPLFGNNNTDQFVELRGEPDTLIPDGTYFLLLEGWGAFPGGPGYIHSVINLSGLSFGDNGFLVLAQSANPYHFDAGSTVLVSSLPGFGGLPDNRWSDGSTLSDRLAFIFNGGTFMLVHAPQSPVAGSDADGNDDGTLDGAAGNWDVIDSVGLLNTTPTPSRSYGKITFSNETNSLYPAGTTLIDTDGGGYVGRIGNSTGWAASDWVSGTTIDGDSSPDSKLYRFTFGVFGDPRPLVYSGRSINDLGTFNFDGGAKGFIGNDNGDGVLTGADTPLPNVPVFADQNANGVRDSVAVSVFAKDYPDGTELTNRFPDATLTVADVNNKNIGFVARTTSTFDNAFNTIRVFSSEGIPWYDSHNRLKVMFYQEADTVSIQSIAAETLKDSFGRMDLYDRNNVLLDTIRTRPLRGLDRETLTLHRPQADIKYAIIFTDDTIPNASPFGPFDNLIYSYPEFQSKSDANGIYSIEELPVGAYHITPDLDAVGKLLLPGTPSYFPLSVSKSEHLPHADIGLHDNTPPVINTASLSIPENPTLGDTVGRVDASDADLSQFLRYQFLDDAGPFGIDAGSGDIRVINSKPWDFESSLPITVTVKVTDSFIVPSSVTRVITLSPSDVNDPPVLAPKDFMIPENSPSGTVVGAVQGTDQDAGLAGKLRYSIDPSGPVSVFSIDPIDGTIKVLSSAQLDFETKPNWILPVVVTDQGTPPLSTTASIGVHLSNVNDPPSNITFSNVIGLLETANATNPISVATIKVIDDTLGTNTLTIGGADASFFSIVGLQLKFQSATPLDFETKPTFNITLSADDPTVGLTPDVTVPFTLRINDVNEAPTGIQFLNVVPSVPELTDIRAGVRVANIKVIDDALGNNLLSLAGTDAGMFAIVGTELRFKSDNTLDFETKSSYQVTVRVDDTSVGLSPDATANFTIAISDVNEPPTAVQLSNVISTLNESATPSSGQIVADLQAIDDALGTNSFLIGGPDADSFEVVGNQLKIKSGVVLDYESQRSYSVTIKATDTTLGANATPETPYQLTIVNRPEVVSVTDPSGNPLGSTIRAIRVAFDSVATVASDAFVLTKSDFGNAFVPVTVITSVLSGHTVADLAWSGPLTSALGLIDGNYVLALNGNKVTASNSVSGIDFRSTTLHVLNPLPPGVVEITAPAISLSDQVLSMTFNLTGLNAPPSGNITFKLDFDGDGVLDRTITSADSLIEVKDVTYASPGSYTILVTAEQNGNVLGKGSSVIDVSPATSANENWLSSLDTDRDNSVSPLDVLVLINRINSRSGSGSVPYVLSSDVDRDGSISPLDVLAVINYLNSIPSTRVDVFSSLVMVDSGSVKGLTNDASIQGKIVGPSRSLYATLDGVDRKDASSFVQSDGSFAINDAAIIQLFGAVADGNHMISLSTRTGTQYSIASDRRFKKLTKDLGDFQIITAVDSGSATRLQWTPSASGARYDVYATKGAGSPALVVGSLSGTDVRVTLSSGDYDLFVEAVDGAGNRKRSPTRAYHRA